MQIIEDLKNLVGSQHVLVGEDVAARTIALGRDIPSQAFAIVRPGTVEEVSGVLELCYRNEVCVVPHGGRTGMVYGCQTEPDHIALSLERLNQIESIDPVNRTMQVQAGVVLQTAQEKADEADLYFPVDLGARGSAMIGGIISTNAGGLNVLHYGMARQNVLGLEAVLADGTVITSLNSLIKNNSGYDLKHLFIGTEGTLGIVTRAVLRLRPKPVARYTAMLGVMEYSGVTEILRLADQQLNLTSFEVMWDSFYRLSTGHHATGAPPLEDHYPYYVLLESSGPGSDEGKEHFEQVMLSFMDAGIACDGIVAQSEKQRAELWKVRDNTEPLLQPGSVHFDVSLPISVIDRYLVAVMEDINRIYPDATTSPFGHLGDNNLHLVVFGDATDLSAPEKIKGIVYEHLKPYHGAVSAEHGIGLDKKAYLPISRNQQEIELMRLLKRSLDPKNILNPGKIFDLE